MKTIYKFSIVLLLMFGASPLLAQQINLDNLPEKQRDSTLIEIAKAAVLKYGPGYWRDYENTEIRKPLIRYFTPKDDEVIPTSYPTLKGKNIFSVRLFYDKTKERLSEGFAAVVYVVAESGIVCDVWFGNRRGLGVYQHEVDKNKTKSSSGHAIVPYQQAPTQPQVRPKSAGE